MSVITWPATLRVPAECSISQARYDMVEASDATGHQSARLFGPPRWRMALRSVDAFTLAEAGQWEALLLQLRGGVNHLAVCDPVRTEPQGSIRGALTLKNTAAAGVTGFTLSGCTSKGNLLLTPSFEVDTDADGLADDWVTVESGTAGTVTASAGSTNGGARGQRVTATALDTVPTSFAGVQQVVLGIVPGQTYTLGVDELSATASEIDIEIQWRTAADAYLGEVQGIFTASTSGFVRRSVTGVAPANAAKALVYLLMRSNPVLGIGQVNFDNAKLELGSVATGLDGPVTCFAGDWMQVGTGLGSSQLVKCIANNGTNSSTLDFYFEPPLRQQFAAGTVVTWDKPLGYFKQTGEPQWSYRPGMRMKQSGFALDLLEAFS